MKIFDERWVRTANKILTGHRTGAVPEFRAVLRLRFGDAAVRDCWVVAERGTQRFSSRPVEPADVVVSLPYDQARMAFAHNDQAEFMRRVLGSGALGVEGDYAKARFFATGLVRNATPQTMRALKAIA